MKIDEVRDWIAQRAVDHLNTSGKGNISDLIIQTSTGSGKTTTVLKTLDEKSFIWIYLSPYHEIIRENIEFSKVRNYDIQHLESRRRVCRIDRYKDYANQGISIEPFCKVRCPYKDDGCPYYEKLREIREFPQCWAGVHSHVPTLLQSYLYEPYHGKMMYHNYDVIIMDEFPTSAFYDQIIVNRAQIDYARSVIESCNIRTPESEFFSSVLDILMLGSGKTKLNYDKLYELFSQRGYNFDDFFKKYEEKILKLLFERKLENPPKNIIYMLRKIWEANPSIDKFKWMCYKHLSKGWSSSGIYLTISYLYEFRSIPVPVIGLDATANHEVWNSLLGRSCEFETIDMQYKNFYQLRYGRYPVSKSWVSIKDRKQVISKTGTRLCKLIAKICRNKENKVLICANMRVSNLISKYLKEDGISNFMFANFYNLRSRNAFYEECDTCIVSHLPNIPPMQVKILENVVGWDNETIQKLYSEDEVKQAVGRIRQNISVTESGRNRGEVEIYVLTSNSKVGKTTPRKVVPESTLVSYKDLVWCVDRKKPIMQTEKIISTIIMEKGSTNRREICSEYKISDYSLKPILRNLSKKKYISYNRGRITWLGFPETKYKRIIS